MRSFLLVVFLSLPASGFAQVTLENPTPGQTLTGLGLLSGWACEAQDIAVQFNGQGEPVPILYGSSRADTEPVCGHDATGFALLVNWNELGAGEHTLSLLIDGQEALIRDFSVVTYGEAFMRGKEAVWILGDWPEPGVITVVAWNEATQNIQITNIQLPEVSLKDTLRQMIGMWILTIDNGQEERVFFDLLSVGGKALSGYTDDRRTLSVVGISGEYQFWLVWSGPDGCHEYSFDLVTPSRMEGVYEWTPHGCNMPDAPSYEYDFTGQKY